MNVTHDLLPDPRFYPMIPTVENLLEYASDIDREGGCVTFDWAVNEINNYSFAYVRIGLVANAVRRFRIYERPADPTDRCQSFGEFCRRFMGRSEWYVNKIIDAALLCYKLIVNGFDLNRLPDCEAQARPLVKIYKQASEAFDRYWKNNTGDKPPPLNPIEVIKQKWQKVLDTLPIHAITANKISEIVEDNPQPPLKQKVDVRTSTRKKWERLALEAGMSPDDYLEMLFNGTLDSIPAENEEETEEQRQQKEAIWLTDIDGLVEKHDEENRTRETAETELLDNGERIVSDDSNDRHIDGNGNIAKTLLRRRAK